jgi:hypothetical protein
VPLDALTRPARPDNPNLIQSPTHLDRFRQLKSAICVDPLEILYVLFRLCYLNLLSSTDHKTRHELHSPHLTRIPTWVQRYRCLDLQTRRVRIISRGVSFDKNSFPFVPPDYKSLNRHVHWFSRLLSVCCPHVRSKEKLNTPPYTVSCQLGYL